MRPGHSTSSSTSFCFVLQASATTTLGSLDTCTCTAAMRPGHKTVFFWWFLPPSLPTPRGRHVTPCCLEGAEQLLHGITEVVTCQRAQSCGSGHIHMHMCSKCTNLVFLQRRAPSKVANTMTATSPDSDCDTAAATLPTYKHAQCGTAGAGAPPQ